MDRSLAGYSPRVTKSWTRLSTYLLQPAKHTGRFFMCAQSIQQPYLVCDSQFIDKTVNLKMRTFPTSCDCSEEESNLIYKSANALSTEI